MRIDLIERKKKLTFEVENAWKCLDHRVRFTEENMCKYIKYNNVSFSIHILQNFGVRLKT